MRERFPVRELSVAGDAWRLQDTDPDAGPTPRPLVLLPGALGTGETFYRVVDALAGERRVLALTFPAVGDAVELAKSLECLLDALGLEAIDLLGTSLGGYVAQVFAIDQPGRIGTLILANSFCDPTEQQARWPAAEVYAQQDPADLLAAARRQLEAGAADSEPRRELRELMLELVGPEHDAAGVKAMRLAVLTARPLPPVPLPADAIVVIDDDADPVITPWTRAVMRQRYVASRRVAIAGGGHFPANLQPESYVAAIRAALQR